MIECESLCEEEMESTVLPLWIHGRMAITETVTLRMSVLVMKNLFKEQLSNCNRNSIQ